MTLVDSTVWIDYFNGVLSRETDLLDRKLATERIGIGDIILSEVLRGFKDDKGFEKAKTYLLTLPCFDLCGKEIVMKSAENYRSLRKKGITVRKTVDMIIGTFCIENDLPLLHSDRDFDPMEKHLGLKVV
ncbi:MAG: PIN domain nuclease [Saprospiraceae bacterium]|nr:MAG: PIN domain nuclease [Saprospiraceae bacterium]